MRRYPSLLFLLSFILAVPIHATLEQTTPAYACSGGFPPSLQNLVDYSDTIVYAEILETDDLQRNGIARVFSYVAGEVGSEYIAIQQSTHYRDYAYSLGASSLDNDCYSTGEPLLESKTGLLFLSKSPDGSYFVAVPNFYMTSDTNATFDASYLNDNEEVVEFTAISIDELIQVVSNLADSSPTVPDRTLPRALHSPLLITTASGNIYFLPHNLAEPILLAENPEHFVVRGEIMAFFYEDHIEVFEETPFGLEHFDLSQLVDQPFCFSQGCFDISTRGLHYIYRASETEIGVLARFVATEIYDHAQILQGESFKPSPTRDLLVVWYQDRLNIYFVGNYVYADWSVDLLNTIQTNSMADTDTNWYAEHAIWSDDSTQFAYTDADGLWLWRGFEHGNEPELLIPANNDLPIAQYFSPQGRYLAIEHGEERFTLDLYSGQRLDYGLISPDEQFLATFITTENGKLSEICSLTSNICVSGINLNNFENILWTKFNHFLAGIPRYYRGIVDVPTRSGWSLFQYIDAEVYVTGINVYELEEQFLWYEGEQIIYDPLGDNLAILNNPTTISISYSSRDPLQIFEEELYVTLDLSDSLDGEIVSLEWLPSHFYMVE